MKKRKNIIISAITCLFSICLMMFGVYAASNPSVSISGQVSYSIHDAKVMVQGKINGTKEYPTDVDYKKPININNLTAGDKLTDSQNQFLNFTTGASLNNDTNDDLGTWNFGNLNFYEDQDGIKTIRISLLVTNLSNYPVKATLTYSNSYDNVTIESNKLEAYLAKYDQSKNADANQSLLTNDEFVVELKVTDDSKNASANNFSMNIKVEKYSDPDATLDKLTLTYNGTLYNAYSSLEQYGVICKTSPQGLTDYYVAEIKQDATGEVVIPAVYNDGEHGDLPVVPGRVNGLVTAIQALGSGKNNEEAMTAAAIPQVTNVILNTGMTEVQNLAFAVMPSLNTIQLPSSLMYHQGGTFGASGALATVSLPYGTKDLKTCPVGTTEMGMFWRCKSLESFWMPDTVQTAGDYIFSLCSNLKQVHLSENLQAISKSMFYANNLTSIEIPEKVIRIDDYGFFQNKSLVLSIIPKNVTTIGKNAFRECEAITTIKMSNNVTSIGDSAFQNCKSLKTAVLSENITDLSDRVFYNCIELTSIIIPSKVKTIGEWSFWGCVSLISFEMPESVVNIGKGALYNCNALKNFDNLYNGAYYLGNTSNPYILLLSIKDTNITTYQINQSTKFIYDEAFSGCTILTDVNIPNNIVSIGNYAFGECYELTNLSLPNNLVSIGDYAFSNCIRLTKVNIPNSVTYIGDSAFFDCNKLKSENNLYDDAYYLGNASNPYILLLSAKDKNITSCQINQNTKFIQCYAFSGCTSLVSIEIPNSVTILGTSAFSGCSALANVELSNSLTEIAHGTFYGCSSLTSVEIPSSVTSIVTASFSDCTALTTVTILAEITSTYGNIFTGSNNLSTIYVPSQSVNAYKTLWRDYADIIVAIG